MQTWIPNYRLALIATVVLISGCASMSPEECRTVQWHEQGMRDGQHGQPRSRADQHREACGKVGVSINMQEYEAGRSIGIRRYCTPENGLEAGRLGRSYQNSCPPELEGRFLDNYRSGYRVYEAQQYVERLDREISSKEQSLRKTEDDDERSRLRSDLRELDRRLRHARDDVHQAERRLR
ncbi:DUF2799 domain-containing protein [Alcaligenaceae bacterium]|nr:DUF2799 domain-containing protein [Alcaligenaceae bacterium]